VGDKNNRIPKGYHRAPQKKQATFFYNYTGDGGEGKEENKMASQLLNEV